MMEENIDDLKEKAAVLERRVELLKERLERARWLTTMLIRAKAPHPRYPFWEWEHRHLPNGTVRKNVRNVLSQLSLRLDGQWEFDETCKDIPGIPSDQLYQARPPTVDEVYTFIKTAGGFTSNAQVREMFVARRMNGHQDKLIDFVLNAGDT